MEIGIKLNAELTKQSLTIICIGFSLGTLIEGSYIKDHQKYGKYKNPNLKNIHWLIDGRCMNKNYQKFLKNKLIIFIIIIVLMN